MCLWQIVFLKFHDRPTLHKIARSFGAPRSVGDGYKMPFSASCRAYECFGEHHMVTSFWKATDGLYTYQNCGFQHPCKLQLARLSTLITAMVTKYNLE